jgi:hypothetical protein
MQQIFGERARVLLKLSLVFRKILGQVCNAAAGDSPRLELATSAVTALREMVLQQLYKHAGTAKRSISHARPHELWAGLWLTA